MTVRAPINTGRVIPVSPVTPFLVNRREMVKRGFLEREVIDFDPLLISTIGMTGMTGVTEPVFMGLHSVIPLDVPSLQV